MKTIECPDFGKGEVLIEYSFKGFDTLPTHYAVCACEKDFQFYTAIANINRFTYVGDVWKANV